MASIPRKSVKGANLKKWLVETIDGILDYLHSSRIRPGYGIAVEETPSGTIVRLAGTPSGNAPVSKGGGTGATGIGATVTGGTASVTLTGGTGSVNLVGTGSVTLSENGNGEIEINATGGGGAVIGFPDYLHPLVTSVQYNTTYPGTAYADQSVWLIGMLNPIFDPNNYALPGHVSITFTDGTYTNTILIQDIYMNVSSNSNELETPVMLPIPAGVEFEITYSGSSPGLGVKIYPCL